MYINNSFVAEEKSQAYNYQNSIFIKLTDIHTKNIFHVQNKKQSKIKTINGLFFSLCQSHLFINLFIYSELLH